MESKVPELLWVLISQQQPSAAAIPGRLPTAGYPQQHSVIVTATTAAPALLTSKLNFALASGSLFNASSFSGSSSAPATRTVRPPLFPQPPLNNSGLCMYGGSTVQRGRGRGSSSQGRGRGRGRGGRCRGRGQPTPYYQPSSMVC